MTKFCQEKIIQPLQLSLSEGGELKSDKLDNCWGLWAIPLKGLVSSLCTVPIFKMMSFSCTTTHLVQQQTVLFEIVKFGENSLWKPSLVIYLKPHAMPIK
jgi:hypothetical protein